jgi:adenosylmethionine-8-amino-7-oxononanoate aminotransferase
MDSEYQVDSAVGRVGVASEKIRALDTALQYNFMLYFVHWTEHLSTLETINNIGDVQAMSMMEFVSLNRGFEVQEMNEREIGNIAPDSYTEDGYWSRICTQFNWGTRYNPPFTHSQDAINCVTATLGKMGQA